jgi:hypothetical protein
MLQYQESSSVPDVSVGVGVDVHVLVDVVVHVIVAVIGFSLSCRLRAALGYPALCTSALSVCQ